jgi:hypothetical protein
MAFMPLNLATVLPTKATLAQGGFFTFAALISYKPFFTSHTTCHCPLPPPSVLTVCLPRPLMHLHS